MKRNIIYNGINEYKSLDNKDNTLSIFITLLWVSVLVISSIVFFSKLISGNSSNNKHVESIMQYTYEGENNIVENKSDKVYINSYLTESQNNFVNLILDGTMRSYEKYGVLPSITIGQAILESGWGSSELAISHNNLFGIKADSRWDGAIVTISSNENYNDSYESNFRKYDSIEDSIEDHGKFLFDSDRYRDNGLFEGKNYIEQAQSLEDAGYSTAKDENGVAIYADKLISVIEKYNLTIYDK